MAKAERQPTNDELSPEPVETPARVEGPASVEGPVPADAPAPAEGQASGEALARAEAPAPAVALAPAEVAPTASGGERSPEAAELSIDADGLEARVTLARGPNGAGPSMKMVMSLLADRGVREGIDAEAIARALHEFHSSTGEPLSFVAARGKAAAPGKPEQARFEPMAIPDRLRAAADRLLERTKAPVIFDARTEKVAVRRPVQVPRVLPFLPRRTVVQEVVERRTVKVPVSVDPVVLETGWAAAGAPVVTLVPPTPGKPGRSVRGTLVAPPPPVAARLLIGEGLERKGVAIRALSSGFVRRGNGWCDLIPFRDHVVELASSSDCCTCLLSFQPGEADAPAPDAEKAVARAVDLGFAADELPEPAQLASLLREAIETGKPLVDLPLNRRVEPIARVDISPDRMSATLRLRKARGGAPPLVLPAIAQTIRASGVKGYDASRLKQDILAFYRGSEQEMRDYPVAKGKAPGLGSHCRLEWKAAFLPPAETERLKAAAQENAHRVADLRSLVEFPPAHVESIARVSKGTEVLRIAAAEPGSPGTNVLGQSVPGTPGRQLEVRAFEGLTRRGDTLVAALDGILERGVGPGAVLLRVRPHRDAKLEVALSQDRMKATVSFLPSEGTGSRIGPEELRGRLEQSGILRGISTEAMLAAMEAMARGEPLSDLVVAEGQPATLSEGPRVVFHVSLASGRAVSIRGDGSADYRSQDRITLVKEGQLLATISEAYGRSQDGWDLTGATLPAPAPSADPLQPGKGIRTEHGPAGELALYAEREGELVRSGPMLEVRQTHIIEGDVGIATGDVRFAGMLRVTGSVRSGSSIAAHEIAVDGGVEGARLAATGSITVGQGIVGGGKAALQARGAISASFAEEASLVALSDITLSGACLHCRVKTNGKLTLSGERGRLSGGTAQARQGADVQDLGSPGGARTTLSFGQDYQLQERIRRMEAQILALQKEAASIDARPLAPGAAAGSEAEVEQARARKAQLLREIETRSRTLIDLRDAFDEHVPSEAVVRGTLYPGAEVESHSRKFSTNVPRHGLRLVFDTATGRIVERGFHAGREDGP